MSALTLPGELLTHVHNMFKTALPRMRKTINYHRRRLGKTRCDDFEADALSACWHAFVGLVKRGKDPLEVGPAGIATNAVRYVTNGRQFGTGTAGAGATDVFRARQRGLVNVVSLNASPEATTRSNAWRGWLTVNKGFTPADAAALAIDFQEWLSSLPPRKREMAQLLAAGYGTSAAARLLGVSAPAVSIARSWLEASWQQFQGESNSLSDGHLPRR
jgi:hypothetical protein